MPFATSIVLCLILKRSSGKIVFIFERGYADRVEICKCPSIIFANAWWPFQKCVRKSAVISTTLLNFVILQEIKTMILQKIQLSVQRNAKVFDGPVYHLRNKEKVSTFQQGLTQGTRKHFYRRYKLWRISAITGTSSVSLDAASRRILFFSLRSTVRLAIYDCIWAPNGRRFWRIR